MVKLSKRNDVRRGHLTKGRVSMVRDLTQGKESKVLIEYTLPMFVGVAFQQLYNISDSIIAGKFAGEDALAAVGASYAITMLFMAVAVGCQIGCTVVVSRLFGAKDFTKMKTAIFTILISGFFLSLLLSIVGVILSPTFMKLLKTPENIFEDSELYLKIYIAGFLFLFLYNVVTGIFNSLGDSKTPLVFLICSSLGNIFLDWLFVAVFHKGVVGVAVATFIAQSLAGIAASLVLLMRLKKMKTPEKPELFSKKMLSDVARVAIPSVLQQSFISVGNLFIQKLVNNCGSSVIAGYSAAIKLNTFAITGFTTLGNGISSFTAQNLGAGKKERIRRGLKAGILFSLGVALVFFLAFFLTGETWVKLFMDEDASNAALQTGKIFLRIVAPFYFVICVKLLCDGMLRGCTKMKEFMVATFTDLILRVVLAHILCGYFNETGIFMSWPIGWTIATVISLIYSKKCLGGKKLELEED